MADNRVQIVVGANDTGAKVDLDQLRAKLDELGRKVAEARVKVGGDKEAAATLDKMQLRLTLLGDKVANPRIKLEGATRAASEIVGLDLALDHLNNKMSSSRGGLVFGIGRVVSAFGGFAGIGTTLINPITIALGALAAIMAGPLIAGLGAITLGFGAFAAGAKGEIEKVLTAHQKLVAAQQAYARATTAAGRKSALEAERQATEHLSGSEKNLMGLMSSLGKEFGKLQKAVQPMVISAFGSAIRILKDLMPALIPLAQAAGRAIDGFLKHIDSWLRSGSGQKFIHWLQTDGVHAIQTFGRVMWDVAQAVGRTFSFLRNAGNTWWKNFHTMLGELHAGWSNTVHFFVQAGHNIENAWDRLSAASRVTRNIVIDAFGAVVRFITGIPGRTAASLASVFRPLISAGKAAYDFIVGIVHDIEGVLGGLAGAINNALGGIPGKVLGFLGFEHGGIVGAAGGGPRSRLTMVGEHGRELLDLPPGTRVHSNPDTERMLAGAGGGGPVKVELEITSAGTEPFINELARLLRNHARVKYAGSAQRAFGVGAA